MTKENSTDLLLTKFYSSKIECRNKLLKFFFDSIGDKNIIVDILNNKKLYHTQKNFFEGDIITINLDTSMYPNLYQNYYIDNGLVINETYIRVKVQHINPVNGYIGLNIYTSNTKEEVVEVYHGHLIDQDEIKLV